MTHYIRTHSGVHFDYVDAEPEDILLTDIAHSLARLCRFNGHCTGFVSVAEHSVWCASRARERGHNLATQRWALMHDAAEAYTGDVPSPLKALLPDFQAIEARVERLIALRFRLGARPVAVGLIDREALAHEFSHRFELPSGLTTRDNDAARFMDMARVLGVS